MSHVGGFQATARGQNTLCVENVLYPLGETRSFQVLTPSLERGLPYLRSPCGQMSCGGRGFLKPQFLSGWEMSKGELVFAFTAGLSENTSLNFQENPPDGYIGLGGTALPPPDGMLIASSDMRRWYLGYV